jgi:hypothetical protein
MYLSITLFSAFDPPHKMSFAVLLICVRSLCVWDK